LSLIELSIATLFFFISSRAYERADVDLLPSRLSSRLPADRLSPLRLVSLIAIALFFSLLVFSPLAAMLISALREMMHPSTVSSVFISWGELALVIGKAAKTSFTVASLSALISTAAGGLAAYLVSRLSGKRGWLDHLALLPAAISGIVIGMGYLKYYHGVVEGGGLLGWLAFALLHSAVNFPFAYRIVSPQCRQITASIVDASSLLGASRFQLTQSILIPLLRPALINSLALTFALSLGEFTATSMLYSEELRTIPILIYQLIGSYRLREASILGAAFLGIALFVFWLLERHEIEEGEKAHA
ncbi:MAG: iron ABC transporter permease, partial [Deltaproteobacteria bacterium]|nr:iron ABC transporter permease [Deltaproteobacteria bacterium]